jgi:hypothetical protein
MPALQSQSTAVADAHATVTQCDAATTLEGVAFASPKLTPVTVDAPPPLPAALLTRRNDTMGAVEQHS